MIIITIKQLFAVDECMIKTLKITAIIVAIVAAFVFVSLEFVGGICGVLLMIACTILTAIGTINYMDNMGGN